MPSIIVEAGMLNSEKKKRLIRELTETASEISGVPQSSFTVLLKENPIENWGVGGTPLVELMNHS